MAAIHDSLRSLRPKIVHYPIQSNRNSLLNSATEIVSKCEAANQISVDKKWQPSWFSAPNERARRSMDVSWIGIQWRAIRIWRRHDERRAFTHTTICLRPSRGLRMNLRVRRVTGASLSAMVAVLCACLVEKSDEGETQRFGVVVRSWEKGLAAKLKPGQGKFRAPTRVA